MARPHKPTANSSHSPALGTKRRCAIYTRKSSEEGLEQEFNSLDAQREACAAYIASQRHEGWVMLPTFYDDGGISGGTLDRPALKQLLADIAADKVDLVVVYKVDRLTRSLSDFAKIVDVFDASGASFVSVTQQFNTATSMGRLTLNMLLSFAQFEREFTGERIRDKIAASKRKGMWMGGVVPLGYDVVERALVINPTEAALVRDIFAQYLALGSVRLLAEALRSGGKTGKAGFPFRRGALFHLLQNHLYRGEISHRGQVYPGQHEAIIPAELWDAVQALLAEHRVERSGATRAKEPSLLTGLVRDADGRRLVPSHAVKQGRRYRYYITQAQASTDPNAARAPATPSPTLRLPAANLERLVEERLKTILSDPNALLNAINGSVTDAAQHQHAFTRGQHLADGWDQQPASERRARLQGLLNSVVVHPDHLALTINAAHLHTMLIGSSNPIIYDADIQPESLPALIIPIALQRAGLEMRLLVPGEKQTGNADSALIKLIARGHQLRDQLLREDITAKELSERVQLNCSYVSRLIRLAYLAPDIVKAILDGWQPVGLNANRLVRDTRLPLDWSEQRRQLGFC